jgi:dihydroxyacetone kinase
MGIHNEEGFGRYKSDLPGLIKTMLDQLLNQSDKDRAYINIQPKEDAILLINNLGGLSQLELGAITTEVCTQLKQDYNINLRRILAGTYMSSLNGLGFSITLLKLVDEKWLQLIDAPTKASGWLSAISVDASEVSSEDPKASKKDHVDEIDVSQPGKLQGTCRSPGIL